MPDNYNTPSSLGIREAGTFGLGAHLRERGQKPGVLRQVGEG